MAYVILLALVGYLLFFFGLGSFSLIGDSEGNYAEIAREMLESGNYIVPYLNYVPYIEKPPFFYWLTAFSYKIFGLNEWAARLWAAIPALGLVFVAYLFGVRLQCRGLGVRSGLVLATSAGFILMSKICYMDMLFSFLIAAALYLFYCGLQKPGRTYSYAFAVSLALAVLTKGFAGVILPALVIVVYLTVGGRWRDAGKCHVLEGLIVFLVITVPWHAAIARENGEFTWYYFVNEHLYRYLGIRYPKDYFRGPVYYHLLRLFAMLFPWSIFIPAASYLYIKKLRKNGDWLFLIVWSLAILAFFSVSRAKANYYMLSALVPVAVLIGWMFDKAVAVFEDRAAKKIFEVTCALYSIAGFSCMVVLYAYPQIVIKNFSLAFFPYAVLILFSLTLSGLIAAYFLMRKRVTAGFIVFFLGALAAGFIIAQNVPYLNPEKSARDVAEIIEGAYREGDIIAVRGKYEKHSTASFYLKKRAYVVCQPWRVDGDLDFGSRYPEHRKYFVDWNEFGELFKGPQRVFFITKERGDVKDLREQYPGSRVLYGVRGRYLITNR